MGLKLWDKIATFFKRRNIATPERTLKDQDDLNKLGGVSMVGTSQFVIEQTNLSLNRLQRYRDYSQMDNVGEISLALDLFADESSLIDPELKQTVLIKSKYIEVKKELEHLFYNILNINQIIRSVARYLCKYGDFAWELIPSQDRNSIAAIKFINIYNFTRIETKYGDLVGFYYQDNVDTKPQFLDPWQCSHMRLTSFENIFYPYGRSILEPARKAFKQLRLMEDSAIVYRLCLVGDTEIWTSSGHKKIEDLQEGDHVYSYSDDDKLIDSKVVKMDYNGMDKIWEVKSENHTIYGNKTHPVLVRNRTTKVVEYVDIQDLDISEHQVFAPIRDVSIDYKLILPQAYITKKLSKPYKYTTQEKFEIQRKLNTFPEKFFKAEESIPIDQCKIIEKIIPGLPIINIYGEDYDGIRINREPDEQFMEFLGYFIANIYISKLNDEIIVGLSDNKFIGLSDNEKFINLFKKYFYKYQVLNIDNRTRYVYIDQIEKNMLAQFLLLNGIPLNKSRMRIPQWIFTVSIELRDAFIKGLIKSNVCKKNGDIYIFETRANKLLIKTIKDLLLETGYDVTIIDELTIATEFRKRDKYEDIVSIKEMDEKDYIYDITVSSHFHNFVANGIVVHNTRAPEKRIITIPVGDIPASEVDEYMVEQARKFKKRNYMDLGFNDVSSRWNPMIAQDDYFLPQRPDGTGPTVTTLQGAENLDEIKDIEYFKKKMISALKIPFNRVGIGEQPTDAQQSLSQVAPEFAKSVQWIQREIINGLKKIAFAHLALRRFNEDRIRNFDISMTASSAIDELYRIETWSSRSGVIRDLLTAGLPIDYVLKRFTDLTDDEIEEIKKTNQQQQQQQSQSPFGGLAESTELLNKIKEKYNSRYVDTDEDEFYNNYDAYLINNELGNLPNNDSLLTEELLEKSQIEEAKYEAIQRLNEEREEYRKELQKDYYYNIIHQHDDDNDDEITENDIPV